MLVDLSPDGLWTYLEFLLIPLMFGVGIFFLVLGARERKRENPSTATFNLGYAVFFLVNSVNQLAYVVDSQMDFLPGFRTILRRDYTLSLFGITFDLNSQIVFMITCFLWGFTLNVYAVEKYVRNSKRFPLTIVGTAASGLALAMWLLWYVFQVPTPHEAIFYLIGVGILFVGAAVLMMILMFVLVYVNLARKTPGAVRTKSLIIAFGILFMYVSLIAGNLLRGEGLLPGYLVLIGPVLLIAGIVVLVYGFAKKI